MIRAHVVVASDRAAAGVYPDTSGPLLAAGLSALGCEVTGPLVVPDGEPVAEAVRAAVAADADVVVTSGGTGITPGDRTPEVTRALLDYEIPGIAEAIRAHSAQAVPAAALSRGLAGVRGRTLVVNLPGSTGGARDGLAVLGPILGHAVDQLRGGDHGHPAGQPRGDDQGAGGDQPRGGDH
ncbi:MogA/MoaB family molybdenum cofactor biosynthesis protein [Micromonosporaceae bacterium DT55]|uniref:MogA/MoaB family molybdenum cofactor biosynthesis protein n=1 Tax=Melissospora conviva TaxID=3388432 RepID=UPI003C1525C2